MSRALSRAAAPRSPSTSLPPPQQQQLSTSSEWYGSKARPTYRGQPRSLPDYSPSSSATSSKLAQPPSSPRECEPSPRLPHSMISLKTINLTHRFPDGSLGLNDISLSFHRDSFALLLGDNGAGKTLLAKHLVGLESPTGGSVELDGIDIRKTRAKIPTRIGYVFQHSEHQIIGQTVRSDIAFGPRNLSLPVDEQAQRVDDALTAMNLSHLADRDSRSLSGGEQRRLAIAGTIAMDCELIILDEPFANLDRPSRTKTLQCLVALFRSKCGLIVLTHDSEHIEPYANQRVTLQKGTVAEIATRDSSTMTRWKIDTRIDTRNASI